jgi:hypothetical protein
VLPSINIICPKPDTGLSLISIFCPFNISNAVAIFNSISIFLAFNMSKAVAISKTISIFLAFNMSKSAATSI